MEGRSIILFVLIFTMGAISASLLYQVSSLTSEKPADFIANPVQSVTDTLAAATQGKAVERISPSDHVRENQIKVYNDKITLDIQNATWSTFADSNSMDPFLDTGSNGIEIKPVSEADIKVGDIVSYESHYGIIIHRVIKIDADDEGTYFIMKGDNNPVQDPDKVRFSQVKGILVGIIY